MPRKPKSTPAKAESSRSRRRPLRILVVDPEPQFAALLERCLTGADPTEVITVRSLAEAQAQLQQGPIDVALIEPTLPDGSGLDLADELRKRGRRTRTIVISGEPSLEAAVQAIRAGAADFLIKPLDLDQLNRRVREVLAQRQRDKAQADRIRKLRAACRKLNQARVDVSRQVDILCNDLVTAYQELACQMQQVVTTREFEALVRKELDLEQVLRKTLQYLIDKAGPTNAAIFLPATADEFSLGGYVNYDCAEGTTGMLLGHLADVAAPKVIEQDDVLHFRDDEALGDWLGDDAAYLADCELIAFGCRHEEEALAVLVLFRDRSQPFDEAVVETCRGLAPVLGRTLVRIIRIHHRHLGDAPYGT